MSKVGVEYFMLAQKSGHSFSNHGAWPMCEVMYLLDIIDGLCAERLVHLLAFSVTFLQLLHLFTRAMCCFCDGLLWSGVN